MLTRSLLAQARRAASTLATEPGRTLFVSGSTPRLVVRTNMETYLASVMASQAGGGEVDVSGWAGSDPTGDLRVVAACDAAGGGVTTVSVPASFNIEVAMGGACDVEVDGWIEGTVAVAVSRGSIVVNTVRGLLTTLSTGEGQVRVKHIEGNLRVLAGGAGGVELGKVMGEEVEVASEGVVQCRALYSKRLDLAAAGGVRASVLGSEAGELRLSGGCSAIDSSEGDLSVRLGGAASLDVQAAEGLRRLCVSRDAPTPDQPAAADDAAADAADVVVHFPEAFGALRADLCGASVEIDPRLSPQPPAPPAAGAGPAHWTGSLGAGDAAESDAHERWLAGRTERKMDRSPGGVEMFREGSGGGGGGGGGGVCELTVAAPASTVRVDVQSWFEQRMKTAMSGGAGSGEAPSLRERRPQPYR